MVTQERYQSARDAEQERRRQQEEDRRAAALDRALTSHERNTAWSALIVAALRYEDDAKECVEAGPAGKRLAEQFQKQAREARALAERME